MQMPERTSVKERILHAALQRFSDKGYGGATTQSIAKLAGVSEKTLFKHFPSKQQLFEEAIGPAMLQTIQPFALDGLERIIASLHPSLLQVVLEIARDRVQFALQRTDMFKLVLQELLLHPDFRERFTELWKSKLLPPSQSLIDQMKKTGELRDLPTSSVLRTIISCIAGYALTRTVLAPDENWEDETELKIMTDILLNGLGARN